MLASEFDCSVTEVHQRKDGNKKGMLVFVLWCRWQRDYKSGKDSRLLGRVVAAVTRGKNAKFDSFYRFGSNGEQFNCNNCGFCEILLGFTKRMGCILNYYKIEEFAKKLS